MYTFNHRIKYAMNFISIGMISVDLDLDSTIDPYTFTV